LPNIKQLTFLEHGVENKVAEKSQNNT